ncbi:MAG: DNA replication and repair protein RecF [Myxococcota bacterium]|nr:DNA replication and repair protein RecF [Myxococcota bacterium]
MSRLTRLELKGFRSWAHAHWAPEPEVNLLIGANGVGKTSLLETVYITTQLRPPAGLRWRELIPQGGETGFLAAEVADEVGACDVRIGFDRSERRIKVDGQTPRQLASFAASHPIVFFRPGDLSLVQGGPRGRRRLLDQVAEHLLADHREVTSRYAQALAARNALLRPRARGGELLDLWSDEAARYGAQVMINRQRAAETLAADLQPAYEAICAGKERLSAEYRPSVTGEDLSAALLHHWRQQLDRDRRQGYTQSGPHAEDWALKLDGRDLRGRASQGQQRSAVLACRLAQVELIAQRRSPPILLLDDIAGELDDRRTEALFARLLTRAGQVFITATRDPSPWLKGSRSMTRYRVEQGAINRL